MSESKCGVSLSLTECHKLAVAERKVQFDLPSAKSAEASLGAKIASDRGWDLLRSRCDVDAVFHCTA